MLSHTIVLPFAVGALGVDLLFLTLNYYRVVFVSRRLTEWYTGLGPSAVAMDTLVILLVTNLGVATSRWILGDDVANLGHAALAVVVLQLLHDVCFASLFWIVPRGRSYLIDVFKDYALEVRFHALWSDTLMVLGTLAVAEAISTLSEYQQLMVFLATVYLGFFALYAKEPCGADRCRAAAPPQLSVVTDPRGGDRCASTNASASSRRPINAPPPVPSASTAAPAMAPLSTGYYEKRPRCTTVHCLGT